MADTPLLTGTITELSRSKGYGFLLSKDGQEVFFHFRVLDVPDPRHRPKKGFRGLIARLAVRETVQYRLAEERDGRGPRAQVVYVLTEDEQGWLKEKEREGVGEAHGNG